MNSTLGVGIGSVRIVNQMGFSGSGRTQRIVEHFRCPDGFLDFSVAQGLSPESSFFRFHHNLTYYGRSRRGDGDSSTHDLWHGDFRELLTPDGKICLPFDPDEIIDNLRLEKYVADRRSSKLLRTAYYLVRPLTTLSMRKRIQRFHARNWRSFNFPQWPVDTTVENTCETLLLLSMQAKNIAAVPFVWFWPAGAEACVSMTHDVECQTGLDSCDELLALDDSYGMKASFQIVPEERYHVSPDLSLIATMRDRGFEVGIQDLNHDGRLFDNREEFLRRAALINGYLREYNARGFRAAVLYRRPEWLESLEASYDMSMPNVAPLDPQRGGCCTVMPYFIGNILEIPVTTTQDYTLLHVLNQPSIELWKTQIQLILKKNGLASFIIHPDYILEQESRSVYEELLKYLRELRSRANLWFALSSEIDSWWRTRSQLRVERHGKSWRITGEGAEQATLAYAKNVDGQLVYQMAGRTATVQ